MTTPLDPSSTPKRAALRRRRLTPLALITGVVGAVILAFSMNSSLAAFTASIVNTVNNVSTGTLIMQEQNADGTITCLSTAGAGNSNQGANTANCTTINKYGGALNAVPGSTSTTVVRITNTGTAPANSFTLSAAACTGTGSTSPTPVPLCTQLGIVITQTVGTTTTTITPANSTLTSITAPPVFTLTNPVAPGQTVTFTFIVNLPAASGNAYQGLTASQQLTWTFTS